MLRCVEEGRLSLDDRIGQFKPDSPDANATIRQILTHTSGAPDGLVFAYRPERLEPLARAIRACTDDSFRETLANLLDRLAMIDSVARAGHRPPGTPHRRHPVALRRRTLRAGARTSRHAVHGRTGMACPPSQYRQTTLTPASGLISTVRDFAQFDLALKKGVLLRPDTLAAARRAPSAPSGLRAAARSRLVRAELQTARRSSGSSASRRTPHRLWWSRCPLAGVTLVLLANSDGLVKPFALTTGNVTASPFVRLFLGLVVR